ncbi:Hemerythrin HHE cation binding domain-containing protein [Roseivivax halotolerans]|uniref:Hemerythrin HHE cation binding domain-containing protein n=1 Tax=Roseivivax halotolerans TaxID=93684 RepID=A0A1I5ZHC9_9RHOB|nr:hemerythrin domain-containing protein [Roseivivax halotolerans]SFQ55820.1 Hemerythrin HHE cation binding domain-containing protein [Roseivivax halotolerans]
MSIYDAIIADHEHHRDLLNRIADTTGDSEERKTAWNEFFYDVKSHAAAEEETFYSKLMSKTWGQDSARHSVEEHAEMDDLMEELNEMDMSSPGWLNKFNTLKHDYEHHMEEEEEEVFGRAREVIPDDEIEGYGKAFRERKEKEKGLVDKKREDSLED